MAQDQATALGQDTIPVRQSMSFETDKLDALLAAKIDRFKPPVAVEQFKGGQSNPTYMLRDAAGRRFVLRRKPPGVLLKSAHAVDREYRIMTALKQTDVPVPTTYLLCEDDEVVGSTFFVMEFVEGRIFWEPHLPEVAAGERGAIYDGMNDALARLHMVDYEAIGLGDYGKPGNYFARQISRWSGQYLADEEAGRIESMDRLIAWLPENIPPGDDTSIVHGDFRLDNMIFHPTEPRVIAILDWELSTLGHPLADFSYNCLQFRLRPDLFSGMAGLNDVDSGIPSEEDYIAAYCRRTGRDGIPDMDYYIAFNLFRLAAILHGIQGRVIRGTASSKEAAAKGAMAGAMADAAWAEAEKIINRS